MFFFFLSLQQGKGDFTASDPPYPLSLGRPLPPHSCPLDLTGVFLNPNGMLPQKGVLPLRMTTQRCPKPFVFPIYVSMKQKENQLVFSTLRVFPLPIGEIWNPNCGDNPNGVFIPSQLEQLLLFRPV